MTIDPKRSDAEIPEAAEGPDVETSMTGAVPPGGGGADSGATDAVHVDDEEESAGTDSGSMNNIPGVGPRPAGGH